MLRRILFSKFGSGQTRMFPEKSAHVGHIRKIEIMGYLVNIQFGIEQKMLHFGNHAVIYYRFGRLPFHLFYK